MIVSLEEFFIGNDDLGSIGCNFGSEQPSIQEFFETLKVIRAKPQVQDVLMRMCDYDDLSSWPYTDYNVTSATNDEVEEWVAPLKPSEIYHEWMYGKPVAGT